VYVSLLKTSAATYAKEDKVNMAAGYPIFSKRQNEETAL
jgi:hypothetical protein